MTLTPSQLDAINAQLAADPTYQRLLQQALAGTRSKNGALGGQAFTQMRDYLKSQYGIDAAQQQLIPDLQNKSGKLVDATPSAAAKFIETVGPYLAAGAAGLAFAPVIAGALGAGGAGVGTGATSGAWVPAGTAIAPSVDIGADALAGGLTSSIPTVGTLASLGTDASAPVADVGAGASMPAAGGASSAVPGAAPVNAVYGPSLEQMGATPAQVASATGAGGGGFSGFVKTLGGWPTVIGAGVGLAGSAIQANAANHAADVNAQAARDALGVNTQIYNTNTGLNVAQANQNSQAYNTAFANTAPYRALGAASLNFLGQGLPGFTPQTLPAVTPVRPLSVPQPISAPGGPPGQSIPNQAYIPTTQQTNGLPQMSTGNNWASNSNSGPPKVGDKRLINGQVGTWDGKGWAAA